MVAHFGSRAILLTCLHILHHGVSATSTGLQASPGITLAPDPVVPVSTTSFDIRSSASDLSVAFIGALPLLENWIQTPDAPRATAVTDTLNDILPKALDLLDKLPTPTDGVEPCYNSLHRRREHGAPRPRQRSLFGGLFKTSSSLLNCIVDTTSKVRDEVIKGTKDTVYIARTIQDILKPMLDVLHEVEDIRPSGSPSGSPTSPGYSKAPNGVLVKPSPIGTSPLSEEISVKDERIMPTLSKDGGQHKRALPHPSSYQEVFNELPMHEDYVTAWLVHRILESKSLPHGIPPLHTTGTTEALWHQRQSWGLAGLYGCTSVIVLSPKRMYMTHIWEVPTMTGTPEVFERQALHALEHGDAGTPGLAQFVQPGTKGDFERRRNNPVQAFIITPFELRHMDDQPWVLRYQDQVDKISELLERVLGLRPRPTKGEPPQVLIIPYVSRTPDPFLQFGHGKILIQYEPGECWKQGKKSIEQFAAIELWVETTPTSEFSYTPRAPAPRAREEWRAHPGQSVPDPDDVVLRPIESSCIDS